MKSLNHMYRHVYNCVFNNLRGYSAICSVKSETEKLGNGRLVCGHYTRWFELEDLLQRCSRKNLIIEGKICHGQVIQAGLETNTLMSNILINMYSKCGSAKSARQVFDKMPERSLVSWNTMIGAHTQYAEEEEALKLFMNMQREGTLPSGFTLSSVLCACAASSAVSESRQLHTFAIKTALDSNVFVGTAMLDVYAKCNLIRDACLMFDKMPERNAVTWSSMVAGLVKNDLYEEALKLFHRVQKLGLEQTQFTLSATLSACASLAALIEGNQVHAIIVRIGFGSNLFVGTSLIDMYAKSGSIEEAYRVFSSMNQKNIVLWNSMIGGFSRHARCYEALILFEKMQQIGLYPNEITYVSVISACSHIGLVDKGRRYFHMMIGDKKVEPNVTHYACMVDLLARAGMIYEAQLLINTMSFEPTASMWGSLLGACRIHGNPNLAEIAAKNLFEIEPDNAGNHVLLSNVYAANKRWEDVVKVRKMMRESGMRKEKGRSWIEAKSRVHTFAVGEANHPRIAEIYSKLEDLEKEMKKLAYKSETEFDLHDVGEDAKEELLRHHSEKLALAFGLIAVPSGSAIRIKKNLRVCGDCHSFMKIVSRISGREIIVRDTNRFHHLKDGLCSCGDFW